MEQVRDENNIFFDFFVVVFLGKGDPVFLLSIFDLVLFRYCLPYIR